MDIRRIVSPEQVPGVERLRISSEARHEPPSLAVMTRTLAYSPVIKWVFAARIRHAQRNDVVLVRENLVEIKLYTETGRLEDVAFKADFDGPIRAANIIGTPRTPDYAVSRDDAFNSRSNPPHSVAGPFQVPPQMLALVLETSFEQSLLIMFAFYDEASNIRYALYRHTLFASTDASARLGEHLAVDPQ